jgi:glycosyltransferase involved in cell wall biosynthesis
LTSQRPYSVLLVDLAHTFGGAEVRVLTQARALQGRVAQCRVATIAGSALHKRLLAEGLPCEPIEAGRGSPAMILKAHDVIRQGNYHVIDAHNVQSILWGHWAALLARAPGRVSTIHSDFGREYPGIKGWLYEAVLWLNRLVARQYINVTEVLQEKAESRGDGRRSSLIYNAVPVPDTPLETVNPEMRSQWGLVADDYVVAIVARLKPVKGHAYLLEAFAELADLPHVKLLVVGDGPLQNALELQAETLGITERIRFAGFRQDIPEILQAVDCTCLASLSEALPYTVLEAASYARPFIGTAVGGVATLLEDHRNALLVPPQDPAAMAEAIRWMASHPLESRAMGNAAYELVRNSFSVEAMIEQILVVYDRAVQ